MEKIVTEKIAERKTAISYLLSLVTYDLSNFIGIEKAGLRPIESIRIEENLLNQLFRLKLLIKEGNLMRIDYNNKAYDAIFRDFPLEMKILNYYLTNQRTLLQEKNKNEAIKKKIREILEDIDKNRPELLDAMIVIGLWKMISTSSLPAPIELVLREGFSPKRWSVVSNHAIPKLTLELINTHIKMSDISLSFKVFNKRGYISRVPYFEVVDINDYEKIKNILKWDEIMSMLSNNILFYLGVIWFIIYYLETNNYLNEHEEKPQESNALVKSLTEYIIKNDWDKIEEDLDKLHTEFLTAGLNWAVEIIKIPEFI